MTDSACAPEVFVSVEPHFRVGDANDLQPHDPIFPTLEIAIHAAQLRTHAYATRTFAICDQDEDILYLFLQGEQFKRVLTWP